MKACQGERMIAAGPVKPSPELILKTAMAIKMASTKLLQATIKNRGLDAWRRYGGGRIFMAIYCPMKTI